MFAFQVSIFKFGVQKFTISKIMPGGEKKTITWGMNTIICIALLNRHTYLHAVLQFKNNNNNVIMLHENNDNDNR